MKKVIKFWRKMRESVCALQEGIYTNEASLFEMASQILSSVFLIFSRCRLLAIDPNERILTSALQWSGIPTPAAWLTPVKQPRNLAAGRAG